MIDVLTSRGAPGHAPPPGTPPVEVYFSNPDLLWANEFPTPRFGQVGGRQRDRGEGGGQGGGGGGGSVTGGREERREGEGEGVGPPVSGCQVNVSQISPC